LDDAPDTEVEATEERVVDQASAARTIAELRAEIAQLQELERRAMRVRQSGTDRKWDELSRLLQNNTEMFDAAGHRRKLVIFTEHRDTLNYLVAMMPLIAMTHGGVATWQDSVDAALIASSVIIRRPAREPYPDTTRVFANHRRSSRSWPG